MSTAITTSYPIQHLDNPVSFPETLFWGGLWVSMQPLAYLLMALEWILNRCDPDHAAIETFREQLWDYVNARGDKPLAELEALIAQANFPTEHLDLLRRLLSVQEFRPHIREILAGANLRIDNHMSLQSLFTNFYPRLSSHSSQSWGKSDRIVKQILYWYDEQGKLRIQLEKSAFGNSILESILHSIDDYLKHCAFGKQVGPFGCSCHLDQNPISIVISS